MKKIIAAALLAFTLSGCIPHPPGPPLPAPPPVTQLPPVPPPVLPQNPGLPPYVFPPTLHSP